MAIVYQRIVNLRARIKATCPLTGEEVKQELWSHNRVAWAGGPIGKTHKVNPNVHFHLGTRRPLLAPYKVAEQWINRTYQNDTCKPFASLRPAQLIVLFIRSERLDDSWYSLLRNLRWFVKAIPHRNIPHKGLSYKRWKQNSVTKWLSEIMEYHAIRLRR